MCARVCTYLHTRHPQTNIPAKDQALRNLDPDIKEYIFNRLLASVLIRRGGGKLFQLMYQARSSQFSFKVYVSGRCGMGMLVPLNKTSVNRRKKKPTTNGNASIFVFYECIMLHATGFLFIFFKRGNHLHKPINEYCEKGRLWSLL